MARRGRFGRLPRAAPDLTSSIVSMLREYWNLQEQLMVDAWKEGGEVDGKVVTDERILKFWIERRDQMSQDDPLWDYYNNMHDQYDFSIRESEVGLKYAQKKMTAREVARWYSGESKKYPRHSEVYRTIAGQAAKFLEAARAGAKQSAYERKVKAYNRLSLENAQNNINPVTLMQGGLTEAFRYYGILTGNQNFTETGEGEMDPALLGPGDTLVDLTYGDQQMWSTVLDVLAEPGSELHDWFQTEIIDKAHRQGFDIQLPLTQFDLEKMMHRAIEGYDRQIEINKRFDDIAPKGSTSDMRRLSRETVDLYQFLFTLDEVPIYAARRAALDGVRNDDAATPFEKLAAFGQYYNDLGKLITTVGSQNPVMTTALNSERRYLMGDTTGDAPLISENALLMPFGGSITAGEGAAFAAEVAQLRDTVDKLATGDYVAVIDPTTKVWSAVPTSEVQNTYGNQYLVLPGESSVPTFTPGTTAEDRLLGRGEVTTSGRATYGIAYATQRLTAAAPLGQRDQNTGEYLGDLLPAASSTNLGQVARIPMPDGTTKTIYGIWNNGHLRWTAENPFLDSATYTTQQTQDGTVLVVDPANTQNALVPEDPSDPENKNVMFNPRSVVDTSIISRDSPFAFSHGAVALLASTPAGRQQIAGMDADALLNTLRLTPLMDWDSGTDVGELVNDLGAIKAAAASTPEGAARAEYDFYQQLRESRAPERPNIYLNAPDPASFAARMFVERGIRIPGLDWDAPTITVTGFTTSIRQQVNGLQMAPKPPQVGQHGTGNAGVANQPFVPAPTPDTPAPREQGWGPGDPIWGSTLFDQYKQQGAPPPSSAYGQPVVKTVGQISMAAMPGGPSPVPTPGPSAVTPVPTPYAPTPTPYSPPPSSPAPYQPQYTPPPYVDPRVRCFPAGSIVSMSGDTTMKIEDVKPGMSVLAWSSDEFVEAVVKKVWHHEADERPRLLATLRDGTQIEATDEHPFYDVERREFLPLSDFMVGDTMMTVWGPVSVATIERMPPEPVDLYNLTVAKVHTYVVNGVVVHNKPTEGPGY